MAAYLKNTVSRLMQSYGSPQLWFSPGQTTGVSMKNSMNIDDFKKLLKHPKKTQEYIIPVYTWHAYGMPVPQHNYRFHPSRKWAIDYAWPDVKLAVEIEGGFHSRTVTCHHCHQTVMRRDRNGKLRPVNLGGAHVGARYLTDIDKYNTLASMGWVLLRYIPSNIDYLQVQNVLTSLQCQQ